MIPLFSLAGIVVVGFLIVVVLYIAFYALIFLVTLILYIYYAIRGKAKEFNERIQNDPKFLTFDEETGKFIW